MEGFLGIGGTEFVIILIFAFLIFGPDKLPEIARTIGRAIAKFRDAQNEVNEVIKKEVYDPDTDDNPLQKVADKAEALNSKPGQTETFAERKARYDKIRAERKAKEDAAKAAAQEAAAEKAKAEGASSPSPAAPAATADADEADLDALMGLSSKPAPRAADAAVEGGDA